MNQNKTNLKEPETPKEFATGPIKKTNSNPTQA